MHLVPMMHPASMPGLRHEADKPKGSFPSKPGSGPTTRGPDQHPGTAPTSKRPDHHTRQRSDLQRPRPRAGRRHLGFEGYASSKSCQGARSWRLGDCPLCVHRVSVLAIEGRTLPPLISPMCRSRSSQQGCRLRLHGRHGYFSMRGSRAKGAIGPAGRIVYFHMRGSKVKGWGSAMVTALKSGWPGLRT